jgi:hypothetical protein
VQYFSLLLFSVLLFVREDFVIIKQKMEASSTQQAQPETSSDSRRKSNAVEPFLRLQNKATSWSSKSESDLTKLGRGEEKSEGYSSSVASNTHTEGKCDMGEMQNLSSVGLENRGKSTTQRRSVSENIFLVSEASSYCCSHGVSKSRRRNSSNAMLDCFSAHDVCVNQLDHELMKASPTKKVSDPVNICNEYAVPLPFVKPRKNSEVEYGNVVITEERMKRKVSSSVNSSANDDKDISVSSKYSNICLCIGKQNFIEGHYKAAYLCDITVGARNEDASAFEQTSQKVELEEKAKPTEASSLTTNVLSSQNNDNEILSLPKNKYGSLPTPSARDSFISSSEDSARHIYSNLMVTDCLVHKDSTSNTDEENPYGNCTCSTVERAISSVEDEHQISHHFRRSSRASSTSSSVVRSTAKRTTDSVPARLSEICLGVLIRCVSS